MREKKMTMRGEKRGANYSLAAGWKETNLIIIIVKQAQRKPAASPLPPQSNREAFSLHNDLESDKSNRFTVTAWKGPARRPALVTWPDLPSLSPELTPSVPRPLLSCFSATAKNTAVWMETGDWGYSVSPLLDTSPPTPYCGGWYLKAAAPPDKDLVMQNWRHRRNADMLVQF